MRSTFIEDYERNLIETAVKDNSNQIVATLYEMGLSPEDILKATGVDISKK